MGETEIDAPRDRNGPFEPQIISKRSKDVSGIEDKVLSMYAKGMSQRDIVDTNGNQKLHSLCCVLGYTVNGIKDILGIWIGESEGKQKE
jgi:transposase-like protein